MQYQEAAAGSAAAGVGFPGVGKPEYAETAVTGALARDLVR